MVAVVKTTEDGGKATTPATAAAAVTTTLPRSHGGPICLTGQVGRVGGSFRTSLQPPPPQSLASVREYCEHKEGTVSFILNLYLA